MSARTDRRAILAGLAGAAALAVPAVAAAATAPGASPQGDASLPALLAERERMDAIYEAAESDEIEAWDMLARERLCASGPRVPAGWRVDEGGVWHAWFHSEDQIRAYYTDPRRPPFGSGEEIERRIATLCRELAEARITWTRRKAEVGLPAIEARIADAAAALGEIGERIENTPARTLADAVALVRYASTTIDEDSYGYEALKAARACLDRLGAGGAA